jgi:hypothetical protein
LQQIPPQKLQLVVGFDTQDVVSAGHERSVSDLCQTGLRQSPPWNRVYSYVRGG